MPQAAIIPVIMAATAVAGVGMQVAGMQQQKQAAEAQNQAQQQMLNDQRRAEAQRQQAMELDARRKQMENVRNMTVARSLALSNATTAGAQYGSGLQGGYAGISGTGVTNALGISQNLEIGRNIFGINGDITNDRIAYGNASTDYTQGAGLSSLGGSLISSMGTISRLAGGINFGGNPTNVGSATQYNKYG